MCRVSLAGGNAAVWNRYEVCGDGLRVWGSAFKDMQELDRMLATLGYTGWSYNYEIWNHGV